MLACNSSHLTFLMMCSAYRLNKQGNSIQLCNTFSILKQPIVLYRILTAASWHTYRFLRGQVRWSHLSKSFPQFAMIHIVKGFSVVDETEVDVLLKFPCFLYNPENVGNLISSSFSSAEPSLDIWNFLRHIMLKPSMQDFKHDLTSMGDQCDCPMISTFFGTKMSRCYLCFIIMLRSPPKVGGFVIC